MALFDRLRQAQRVAKHTARKDTDAWRLEQEAEAAKTVRFIIAEGYTAERAHQAVTDYREAAQDVRTGPDWPGFRRMIKRAGLVDPE